MMPTTLILTTEPNSLFQTLPIINGTTSPSLFAWGPNNEGHYFFSHALSFVINAN